MYIRKGLNNINKDETKTRKTMKMYSTKSTTFNLSFK